MRTRLILPALMMFALAPAAKAQWPSTFGVRAAWEFTSPSGAGDTYNLGSGIDLGVVYRMPMMQKFYFEPGLYFTYSAMGSKDLISFDDEYYYEGAANLYGIRVPLNVGYSFTLTDNLNLDVYTGPWLNVNIAARQKLEPNFAAVPPVPDKKISLFDHGWKRVDAQWGFGLNFTFAKNYTIGITGGVAFTPLAQYGNKDKKVRIHRNTVAISLGYNF